MLIEGYKYLEKVLSLFLFFSEVIMGFPFRSVKGISGLCRYKKVTLLGGWKWELNGEKR